VALLESQASSQVPELLPIRCGRMAVSPFTYFERAVARSPGPTPTRTSVTTAR
jgi:hypothetical protein